jgi:hypothetical protein
VIPADEKFAMKKWKPQKKLLAFHLLAEEIAG